MNLAHVLVIDDNTDHAIIACDALAGVAHVTVERTPARGFAMLEVMAFDVVISDLSGVAEGTSWLAYATRLIAAITQSARRAGSMRPVPLILTSGLDPSVLTEITRALTNTHALPKPYSPRTLRALVMALTKEVTR